MSKNRYLWQDIRDAKEAWNALMQDVLKELEKALNWLNVLLNKIR